MCNELHFGLYYLLNDTQIVILDSKLMEKLGVTFNIALREDQSKIADLGSVALLKNNIILELLFESAD